MGKARVKSYTMIMISDFIGRTTCYIHCYPQQIWDYSIMDNKVQLIYKNTTLVIPKEDFDKLWKVV